MDLNLTQEHKTGNERLLEDHDIEGSESSNGSNHVLELEIGEDEHEADEEGSVYNKEYKLHFLPHKIPFRLKKNTNGNILSIHHTVREENRLIRVRLGVCCFSEHHLTMQFVAIDKRGNVFVFDLAAKRFWKLSLIILKASIIVPYKNHENEYLIGTKVGQIMLLDVGRSLVLRACQISQQCIHEISFSEQTHSKRQVLVHAGSEAIMVNMNTLTATHRLDFDEKRMSLKFACYVPQMEQLFTCFTNDAIHIWSSVTLKTVQIIHPIRARDRKLRMVGATDCLPVFKLNDETHEDNFMVDACEVENFSEGLIGTYCFTTHGTGLLCLTTMDKYLMLLNPRTFDLQQIFRLHDFVIQRCIFLPQPNQLLLAALTTKGKLLILDCQTTEFKLIIHNGANYINLSNDGKLLAVVGRCGEGDIWKVNCLYNTLVSQRNCIQLLKEAFKQPKPVSLSTNECFNEDIKRLLKRDRLLAILREYGFYPHKYRNLIWCSLLKLPCNAAEFQQLLKMNTPVGVQQRIGKLKIKNESQKRSLIKIWSCLANWCKAFSYSDFFPNLILPFVKMFPKNSVVAFEMCVTLLMNHFQLWFEFHPLPPSDYLGMCENVLQYFDAELCAFYAKHSVKAIDFAWSILSNAFSEIFDEEQWLILWDHIISCALEFTVFCVVAYNIIQREVIMLLPDKMAIEQFFHEQNPVDINKLVKKALEMMKKCPAERHPEKYFKPFVSIPKNVYPKFLRYPREWVAKQEDEMLALQREQKAIEERIRELELNEHKIMAELEEGLKREEHAKRLKEMENMYHDAIKREEERVACQRKLLCLYQKEIRGCRGQVVATLRESERRKRAIELETQMDVLMHNIESERRRNDSAMILVEDELRNQNFEVLAQRVYLEQQSLTPNLGFKFRNDVQRLLAERTSLRRHMSEIQLTNALTDGDSTQQFSSTRDLTDFERKLDEIQREFLCITKQPSKS